MAKDLTRNNKMQSNEIECIRAKLEKAESNGFTYDSKEEILHQLKKMHLTRQDLKRI